jgi:peptidoglycan/LPS O-acetylase OafA/YrhL
MSVTARGFDDAAVHGHRSEAATTAGAAPNRAHLLGIDGLRGIAAVSVLATHTGMHAITDGSAGSLGTLASYGAQGLTLFFAISGFLLFSPYVAALLDGRDYPSVSRFAINRVLRIFPAYLVILLVSSFVFRSANQYGTVGLPGHIGETGPMTDVTRLVPDLFLVQSYVPSALGSGIGPAWSLTTELTFYALLPLLALVAFRLVGRGVPRLVGLLAGPVLLIVVGLVTTHLLAAHRDGMSTSAAFVDSWGHNGDAVLTRSLLAQADLFGYGMLAAIAVDTARRRGVRITSVSRTAALVVVAVVVGIALRSGGEYSTKVIGVCAGALLCLVTLPSASGEPNWLARLLEWRALQYLGLISYSVYLWHEPMIKFLLRHDVLKTHGAGGLVVDLLVVFAVAVALASITYWFVERPALRWKDRLRSGRALTAPARTVVV